MIVIDESSGGVHSTTGPLGLGELGPWLLMSVLNGE